MPRPTDNMEQNTTASKLFKFSITFYQINTTDDNTSDVTNKANGTDIVETIEDVIPLSRILLCAFLFVIVIITILGNIVVLLAFAVVKRLTKVRYALKNLIKL